MPTVSGGSALSADPLAFHLVLSKLLAHLVFQGYSFVVPSVESHSLHCCERHEQLASEKARLFLLDCVELTSVIFA